MFLIQNGFVELVCSYKNEVIIGDDSKIIQWRIEGDNLNFVSQKEKAHDGWINVLLNIGNGHIASGSDDKTIKIW